MRMCEYGCTDLEEHSRADQNDNLGGVIESSKSAQNTTIVAELGRSRSVEHISAVNVLFLSLCNVEKASI